MSKTLVIKITHGRDDPERAGTALTVASTAVASGVNVELFLIHDAVFLATPGYLETMELEHSPPLKDLFEIVRDSGAKIFACTQCLARRTLTADDLREGVTPAGAPQLIASVTADGAVALDF